MLPIGQLFMAGFDGTTVPNDLAALMRSEPLCGVILFRRNITSLKQLAALTEELRASAGRPLMIAVDHEGGRVFRMPPPFTQVPPMAVVGRYAVAHPQDDLAYQVGRMMGQELAAVGINVNFAPVLDINTNPGNPIIGNRALHASPRIVAKLGCRMIQGLLDGGVIPCGKHFPGHGDTPEDSHLALPIMPATCERLALFELVPFKAAIAAKVPMLMTAHILYGAIDREFPVTLSKRAIYSLLREGLGYDGVVVTDDLHMGAIAKQWPIEEATVRAFAAGCDIALICRDVAATRQAIDRTRHAVEHGELQEEVLARSVRRVERLCEHMARLPGPEPLTIIGRTQFAIPTVWQTDEECVTNCCAL